MPKKKKQVHENWAKQDLEYLYSTFYSRYSSIEEDYVAYVREVLLLKEE